MNIQDYVHFEAIGEVHPPMNALKELLILSFGLAYNKGVGITINSNNYYAALSYALSNQNLDIIPYCQN